MATDLIWKKIEKAMVCNHEFELDTDLAYTFGLFPDGSPFEAEIWTNEDESLQISFIVPVDDKITSRKIPAQTKTVGFHSEAEVRGGSALSVGMVDCGIEEELSIIQEYIYKLENFGVITFNSNYYNGYVWYLTDERGNNLAEIIITLFEDDKEYAKCNLELQMLDCIAGNKDDIFRAISGGKDSAED